MTQQDNEVAVGASVEDGAWLGKLQDELRALIAPVFAQARSRLAAFAYIGALLSRSANDVTMLGAWSGQSSSIDCRSATSATTARTS